MKKSIFLLCGSCLFLIIITVCNVDQKTMIIGDDNHPLNLIEYEECPKSVIKFVLNNSNLDLNPIKSCQLKKINTKKK